MRIIEPMVIHLRRMIICRIVYLIMLALVVLTFAVPRVDAQSDALIYVTIGPEAASILHVLVGPARVLQISTAQLADTIRQPHIAALVVPNGWVSESELAAARSRGIPVVLMLRHTSISNMIANMRILAVITHMETSVDLWIARIERGIDGIKAQVAGQPPTRVLVLTPEGYTQGQGALVTELIGIAGGINTAAEAGIPEARQLDDAQIRTFAPEVILLINWTAADAAEFTHNPVLASVPAIQQRHVYRVASPGKDPAYLVQDLQWLADLLHPPLL